YSWGISNGSLPTELSLNSATGVISGTPTTAGTWSFTVKVTDANGRIATKLLSITIYNPLSITTGGLKPWTKDRAGYSEQLSATGGDEQYSWSISSGLLPAGLNIDTATGLISGTPTAVGTYNFTVRLSDGTGATVTKDFTIVINAPLQITTTSLPNGTVGAGYSVSIAYSGGTAPYSWGISNGSLPAGLSLNSTAGVISGTPTTAGTYNFTVRLSDGPGGFVTKDFTIKINAPDIDISPTSLDFGDVGIGLSKDISVTIKNIGQSTLTISKLSITGTGFSLVGAPQTPFDLKQNTQAVFSVRFIPTAAANYSGVLTVESNDPDEGTLNLSLTGTGVNPPDIDVLPATVDFGTVTAGSSKDITITIKNNISSGAALVINNITLTGTGFTLPSPPDYPITITAGSTSNITVRFTPPTSGQFTGTMTISSNDPDEASFPVELKGNGTVPPDIYVSPTGLDFGDVIINQSKTLTLSIENRGGDKLIISSISVPQGFSLKSEPTYPISLEPGATPVTLEIIFIPINQQTYTGTLTISSNDPDSQTLTVSLSGRGIGAPKIEISPESLDFGKVTIGTSVDKAVLIKNTGSRVLNISNIAIQGSTAFTIVSQKPSQINAGEAVQLTIRFLPQGGVPYAANLIVQSDDPSNPDKLIPITGEGTTQQTGGGGGSEEIKSSGGGCSVGGPVNGASAMADLFVLMLPFWILGLRRFFKR
ncbi:MAG: choice-of-anchor D domain-containing protein, partial [Thermodesulfovibrionales bacterium]